MRANIDRLRLKSIAAWLRAGSERDRPRPIFLGGDSWRAFLARRKADKGRT
jgi:hypothetical protein